MLQDARTTVPASADGALTVGALDDQDAKAIYSNYGDALELYAPGSKYVSFVYDNNNVVPCIFERDY